MNPTPTTPQLRSLLDSRTTIEAEIANWRGIAATASSKREAIISDPAALTDPSLYDSAARYQQQSEGTSRKADQLESGLPALDEQISVACIRLTKELTDHLQQLQRERFEDFKSCIAKFWVKGVNADWMVPYPHAPRAIKAKVAFDASDSSNELVRAIAQVVFANTQTESQTPPVRAARLLALIPTLPPVISTETPATPGNPQPPEPPAEKAAPEGEKKSWWFKPKIKSLLSGNPSPAQA